MNSDGVFFFGVIAFFFLLWFVSGGPTKPISFAGPYITPITDVDTVQEGYGDTSGFGGNVWTDIMNGGGRDLTATTNPSPYRAQISISGSGGASSEDPDEEYVVIRNGGSTAVDITGWKLVSGASGKSARIPEGAALPRSGRINDTGRIILSPGDEAIIVTGDSPIGGSFKENMCTGYLARNQNFYPSMNTRCPSASSEFEAHYTKNQLRDDACYERMQSTYTCTTPRDTGLSNACVAVIDDYLTYNGCVTNHQNDADFAGSTWRIYLEYENSRGKEAELWKSSRDAIKLLDTEGKTVDLYTY